MKRLGHFLVFVMLVGMVPPAFSADTKADPVLTAPGEAHQVLASMAGNWTFKAQALNATGTESYVLTGSSQNTILYGGRFLRQEYKCKLKSGEMLEGVRVIGYDNIKQTYQMFIVDNATTRIIFMPGVFDPGTQRLSFAGTVSAPGMGEKELAARIVITLVNKDQYSTSLFTKGSDGKEFKAMETLYSRN